MVRMNFFLPNKLGTFVLYNYDYSRFFAVVNTNVHKNRRVKSQKEDSARRNCMISAVFWLSVFNFIRIGPAGKKIADVL